MLFTKLKVMGWQEHSYVQKINSLDSNIPALTVNLYSPSLAFVSLLPL